MGDFSTRSTRGPGQKEWVIKELVKDLLHFVKAQIRMYLASPERLPSAEDSSVVNDLLRGASALMGPQAMVAYTSAKNCELVSRPGLGFSKLSGALPAFSVNEGVRRKIYPQDTGDASSWMTVWSQAWLKQDMGQAMLVPNNEHPVLRSERVPQGH